MVSNERLSIIDLIMISLGCAFYGLGLVSVNIANHLAEGGVTGITLIIRYWLHIDPALSTILINIPLIIIGYRYLGKKALVYTVYGTLALSFWIWFWQRFYIPINIHNDLFIAGILAGIFGGVGSGIVYKFGGDHRWDRCRSSDLGERKRDPDGKNTTCVRCGRFDVITELFRSTSNDVHFACFICFFTTS